jgi:TRAP-type C4-dicarboxylate transport system permease small subunit
MAQQAAQRSMFRRRSISMSAGAAGAADGAQDINIHFVPTKGQARARLIIGIAMAVMFVAFLVVFIIVAIHIFHTSSNPGFGN